MKLARDFGSFLERTVYHYGYLIGTRGQKCTKELIQKSWNSFPTYRPKIEQCANNWLDGNPDNGTSPEEDDRWKVTDCEGWDETFRNGGDIGNPLTNDELVNGDVSTYTVYNLALSMGLPNGPISTLPKDCPYPIPIGYPGHVGFYHKGMVYQAAGHCPGTVKVTLEDRRYNHDWEYWYVSPYYDYEGWFTGDDKMIICKIKDKDSTTGTQNVISMQTGLNKLGIEMKNDAGKVYGPDGSYGGATHNGLEIFQNRYGLPVNGDEFTDKDNAIMLLELCKLEGDVSQAEYDALKAQLDAANAQIASLNNQLTVSNAKVVDLTNQLNAEKQKTTALTAQLATANNKIADLTNQLNVANAKIADLTSQLSNAKAANTALLVEIEEVTADRDAKLEDLEAIAAAQDIIEKY